VTLFCARFAKESGKPIATVAPAALKLLMDHYWPGNVRELQNIIERATALASGPIIEAADIHLDTARTRTNNAAAPVLPEGMTLEQWEDELIREALRRANGNKSQAARALGLSRNAFRYRLSKIGIPDDNGADS